MTNPAGASPRDRRKKCVFIVLVLILFTIIALSFRFSRLRHQDGTATKGNRPNDRHPTVYIIPADIARARENIKRFDWAKKVCDRIIKEADFWAAKDDNWLLAQVPPKGACFAYGFTGCPICGAGWGIWDKARASFDDPGHVVCDNGHVLPDAQHPDSGTGWVGEDGRIHYFAGSYNAWAIEKLTLTAAENLAYAYSLSGKEKYARKAALILDAVADIYPSCNKGSWDYPSNPPSGRLDRPWYQVSRVLVHLLDQYDQVYHSPSLDGPSITPGLTKRANIEEQMLKNGAAYCYEQSQNGGLNNGEADYIRGVLAAGICLNIPEYIRWAVDGPYGIYSLLENNIGRDGQYYETSALYADHARSLYVTFAEPLLNCRREPYPEGVNLYAHPKFRAMMTLLNLSLNCAGHRPSFGDTAPDLQKIDPPRIPFDPSDYMSLERLYARTPPGESNKDLVPLLNRLAGEAVEERREKALDPVWLLFHAEATPASTTPLEQESERKISGSHVLAQKGIGILRAGGDDSGQALLLRFGPSLNHGHIDDLNYNYFARGYEVTYDLGYDLASTHTQVGWAKQTSSHNLVVVDESSQENETGGGIHLMCDFPGIKVIEASAESSYASKGVSLYRRTMALLAAKDQPYLLDIFRVHGGKQHDYVVHFCGKLTATSGLDLGNEAPGSLAGPDIAWGSQQLNDGDMEGHPNVPYWNPPPGNGYGFLVKPRRGSPAGDWSSEWQVDPASRVRLVMPAQSGVEVIRAEAPGILKRLPRADYLIARRKGEGLSSVFAAVVEPYAKAANVIKLERLPLDGPESGIPAQAFLVSLKGEAQDLVYSSADWQSRKARGLEFAGKFIHARVAAGKLEGLEMIGVKEFRGFGWDVEAESSGWDGSIKELDAGGHSITTDAPLPEGDKLKGQIITFSSPRYSRPTSYRIDQVVRAGNERRILLDGTCILGKGEVTEIKDSRTIISRIPHEYASRATTRRDSGFFRGKLIRAESGAAASIVRTTPGAALALEVEDASRFKKGEAFYYSDLQQGDRFHIDNVIVLEPLAGGDYRTSGTAALKASFRPPQ